jgi:hypothetical protein
MRMLRIVISGAGAASALGATLLVPAVDGCGTSPRAPLPMQDAAADATPDATPDDARLGDEPMLPFDGPVVQPTPCGYTQVCGHTVQVPEAGTFPDLASVCAVPSPVLASGAATVTLSSFDADAGGTSSGFLSVSSALLAALVGDPLLVVSPSTVTLGPLTRTGGGYSFPVTSGTSPQIKVTVTLNVACGGDSGVDASLQTVTSTTELELCLGQDDAGAASSSLGQAWRSSGESCLLCCPIVAEMAPTPILSNNRGDDLPLARALRLRIAALAHAGRHVLLVAHNDAGAGAEYEWHVSGGTIERVADDIVVWTLPEESDGDSAPFGQVAVWNETGAAVENFYWSAA